MESELENQNFSLEGTYRSTVKAEGTILNLKLTSKIPLISQDKYVLIVLDISGSMCGSKLETSKQAISELIQMLYENHSSPQLGLITFNSTPWFYPLQGLTLGGCLDTIAGITAEGGTNFIPVFNTIKRILFGGAPKNPSQTFGLKTTKKIKVDPYDQLNSFLQKKISEVAVVFLSDGEAESLATLEPYIKELKKLAESKLSSAEFHTLGFGADHDARLLEEMTKAMPVQGTFQYIKESSEIKSSIEAISGYLVEKRFHAFVTWKDGMENVEKKVNFISKKQKGEDSNNSNSWEGMVCFPEKLQKFEEIKGDIKLTIKFDRNSTILPIPFIYKESKDKMDDILQNCSYINEELKKVSDMVISGDFNAKKAEDFRDQVAGLRVMLNELIRDIFKLKLDERKIVTETTRDLNEYMDKIGELIRTSAQKRLTNDQIASVNALAYRHVTRNSRLKTIDKRSLQNVDLLNEVHIKAKEVAEKINEEELNKKYETLIQNIGCCALNLSNLPEALKSGDCLCLTFNIGRPEVAIQDASRIVIKQIYPTIICASAFLDSIQHSMKLDPNNSGGFDVAFQGEIVKGASNENITAAMPLYFCKEHWECASEYIKPILGWDVTIDPLGYDYNQLRTVPFLLLIKALEDKESSSNEFHTRVADWILETCCQIIRDEIEKNSMDNLAETMRYIWDNYHKDGTVRGVESIQSNKVFLAYIYCLEKMGMLELDSKEKFLEKMKYMIEEDMRRKQEKSTLWNGTQARAKIKKILNIDIELYLKQLMDELKLDKMVEEPIPKKDKLTIETIGFKEKKFQELYLKKKATQTKKYGYFYKKEREYFNKQKWEKNQREAEEKNTNFSFTVDEEFLEKINNYGLDVDKIFPSDFKALEESSLSQEANMALDSYKRVTKSMKLWLSIWGYDVDNIKKPKTIGIKTPLQLFALYIQNKLHHKNSERQEHFKTSTYFDPFNEKRAKEFIFYVCAEIIHSEWLKRLNSKPKEVSCPLEDIHLFVETKSLEVAAGILLNGFNLGSFEYLQHILKKTPAKCIGVFEKLLMIKNKEYKGVEFDLDFKMRKKFVRQLFTRFQDEYSHNEWKELWYKEKKNSEEENRQIR